MRDPRIPQEDPTSRPADLVVAAVVFIGFIVLLFSDPPITVWFSNFIGALK